MGIRVEEFVPVPKGDKVALDNGWEGETWSEVTHALDAEVVADFKDYPGTGAVFRRRLGDGEVWYLATRITDLDPLLADVGVTGEFPEAPENLELVRRSHEDGRSYLFAINHSDDPATVPATGRDLLTGNPWAPTRPLEPGECAVIRED
jgi:beta-galactosidase